MIIDLEDLVPAIVYVVKCALYYAYLGLETI
jgi:hypothetical protein